MADTARAKRGRLPLPPEEKKVQITLVIRPETYRKLVAYMEAEKQPTPSRALDRLIGSTLQG